MWWIVKNTWPGHDMLLMTISCLVADPVSKSSSSIVFSFGRLFMWIWKTVAMTKIFHGCLDARKAFAKECVCLLACVVSWMPFKRGMLFADNRSAAMFRR